MARAAHGHALAALDGGGRHALAAWGDVGPPNGAAPGGGVAAWAAADDEGGDAPSPRERLGAPPAAHDQDGAWSRCVGAADMDVQNSQDSLEPCLVGL